MNIEKFYIDFENEYRGHADLIKDRLKIYFPFIKPLKKCIDAPQLLDLGCGRGEWLEITQDLGFKAIGVDSNPDMFTLCRQKKLNVSCNDVLTYLNTQPDNTYAVVSAFHLVEHLPFDTLYQLISASLRVLVPGGLLILETPNPENLVVGSSSFYLDPTHIKPIPPNLLRFITAHNGFLQNKVIRCQETPNLLNHQDLESINLFTGVSPDYSVIAQKKADEAMTEQFDEVFSKSYGIQLSDITRCYDEKIERIKKIAEEAQHTTQVLLNNNTWKLPSPLRWLKNVIKKYNKKETGQY